MSQAAPRRAAVLGHPVAHSLSPVLHRAAYEALGLDWQYDAVDVTEEGLASFVAGLDASWAGLSLTMPLKRTALGLLDHVEPMAEVVGAVNTVLVQGGALGTVSGAGGRPVLVGANTDVQGTVAALVEGGVVPVASPGSVGQRSAVVIGSGATAASTLAALAQLGCTTPQVHVRSMARAGATMRAAHRMGVEPRFVTLEPWDRLVAAVLAADVVVSTLPPGAADTIAARVLTAVEQVRGEQAGGEKERCEHSTLGVLLDCAYDPRPTALGSAWRAIGGVVVSGERMLLHQATEQVRLMTGRPAPVDAMEAALARSLELDGKG